LNAQNTISELLQMGVVPIINENDTVAVSVRESQPGQAAYEAMIYTFKYAYNEFGP